MDDGEARTQTGEVCCYSVEADHGGFEVKMPKIAAEQRKRREAEKERLKEDGRRRAAV